MTDQIQMQGNIPGTAVPFHFVVQENMITLRVGQRVCIATSDWMSIDMARSVAGALLTVAKETDD